MTASFLKEEFFSGPTVTKRLEQLAADILVVILVVTNDIISSEIALLSIVNANQDLVDYQQYPTDKNRAFSSNNPGINLFQNAESYKLAMNGYFLDGLNGFTTLKLTQKSFAYHKYAIVENLLMLQELVLLQSSISSCSGLSCTTLVEGRKLAERADKFKDELIAIQGLLIENVQDFINRRCSSNGINCPIKAKSFDSMFCQVTNNNNALGNGNGNGEIFFNKINTPAPGCFFSLIEGNLIKGVIRSDDDEYVPFGEIQRIQQNVMAAAIEELNHDMINFSYSIRDDDQYV